MNETKHNTIETRCRQYYHHHDELLNTSKVVARRLRRL
jgi:hypothetical protein